MVGWPYFWVVKNKRFFKCHVFMCEIIKSIEFILKKSVINYNEELLNSWKRILGKIKKN